MGKIYQYTPVQKTNLAGENIKRLLLEQSNGDSYTNHCGMTATAMYMIRSTTSPEGFSDCLHY